MADPGITVNIQDQTQSIETDNTIVGCVVGPSDRGPLTLTLVSSVEEFELNYGKPSLSNTNAAYMHHTVRSFLEAAPCYVLRVHNGAAYAGMIVETAAGGGSAGFTVAVTDPDNYSFGADESFIIVAKNPGAWGNTLKCSISEASSLITITVQILVGSTYTTVETWTVSKTAGTKDGWGNNIYLEDRINNNSNYIYVVDNTAVTGVTETVAATALLLGANGSTVTATHVIAGWSTVQSSDVDVDLLMAAGWGGLSGSPADDGVIDAMCNVAYEKNAHCFFDTDDSSSESTLASAVGNWSATYARFGSVYTPYLQITDVSNNRLAYMPPSGKVAAAYARLYNGGNKWEVAAGTKNGVLGGVLALKQTVTGTKAKRDILTAANINPIVFVKGVGYVVNGDWTLHGTDSLLQSVGGQQNVTEIAADLESVLSTFLFDNNTEATRTRVTNVCEKYLRDRQDKGGIDYDSSLGDGFQVICNSTNNPALVRAQHKLVVAVYLRLPYTIRYITLNIILVNGEITVDVVQS